MWTIAAGVVLGGLILHGLLDGWLWVVVIYGVALALVLAVCGTGIAVFVAAMNGNEWAKDVIATVGAGALVWVLWSTVSERIRERRESLGHPPI